MSDPAIALCSGGFDPVHSGHCHYLLQAACHGVVVVALNSDEWLIRKKGFRLMPWDDRANVLLMFEVVADVVEVDDADGTICQALRTIKPTVFCNGGDRIHADSREHAACHELGIVELFSVGGPKVQSSSRFAIDAAKSIIRAAALKEGVALP